MIGRIVWLLACLSLVTAAQAVERIAITVPSSIDKSPEKCYLTLPDGVEKGKPLPLLVLLHSWSGNVEQRQSAFEQGALKRGWLLLMPNFRGVNDHSEACGSVLAQQDIVDAVAWVAERYPVDRSRVYLTGSSGGGHMTMLMAGRHPHLWAAASAWVGISDLTAWHVMHAQDRYGEMLRKSCGGAPGESAAVDQEYRARSPKTFLAGAVGLPLDIAAGVHDGHKGSVRVRHSLEAFNVVAAAQQLPTISEAEIEQIGRPNGRLDQPQSGDTVDDATYGRAIYLRRTAGRCRVTIFEGGHEGLAEAALEFLARHTRAEQ